MSYLYIDSPFAGELNKNSKLINFIDDMVSEKKEFAGDLTDTELEIAAQLCFESIPKEAAAEIIINELITHANFSDAIYELLTAKNRADISFKASEVRGISDGFWQEYFFDTITDLMRAKEAQIRSMQIDEAA